MQTIPQAVATILLTTALGASAFAQDTAPTGGLPAPTASSRTNPQSISHATEGEKAIASPVRAYSEIRALLNEFLAKVSDPAMHDRFWANDLIYTGATGAVKSKADIMKAMRESASDAAKNGSSDHAGTFSAEDVSVRQYGEVAVLNFRLVHKVGAKTDTYRNSGTFVKNNGQWQAVSWQATKIEKPGPEIAKKPTGKD